jgi:hypothetical protein
MATAPTERRKSALLIIGSKMRVAVSGDNGRAVEQVGERVRRCRQLLGLSFPAFTTAVTLNSAAGSLSAGHRDSMG